MASLSIDFVRELYPHLLTEHELAKHVAEMDGYNTVVKYITCQGMDYSTFGLCKSDIEVEAYFRSPYCQGVEIVYDKDIE